MTTEAELQTRIAELEAAQTRAEMLYEISHRLNTVDNEDELLRVLARPAMEAGAVAATLYYVDLYATEKPEWAEVVAVLQGEGVQAVETGTRYYLPEFALAHLWMSSPDEPQFIADVVADERLDKGSRDMLIEMGCRAMAIIPLSQVRRWVGLVTFSWDEAHEFDEQELAVYPALTSLISPVVQSRRLLKQVEVALAKTEMLYSLGRGLNAARNEDELLRVLAWPAQEAGASYAALVYIDQDPDGEHQWMRLVSSWQEKGSPRFAVGTRFSAPEFPILDLWSSNPDYAVLITDIATDDRMDESSRDLLLKSKAMAMGIIPLARGESWVGLVVLIWRNPHEFSQYEVSIYDALASQAAPTVESRYLVSSLEQTVEERTSKLEENQQLLQGILDNSTAVIYAKDPDGRYMLVNRQYEELFEVEREKAIGETDYGIFPIGFADAFQEGDRRVLTTGTVIQSEEVVPHGSEMRTYVSTRFPLRDDTGQIYATAGVYTDITARKQAEEAREQLQQDIINAQKQALQELSTPIIPLLNRIIVMPLVGSIDSMRARDITRALLAGIQAHRAKIVIVDITGVPLVDSGVVSHLNKTIHAARLKGARTIITGVSDAVAETIVDLGIDWSKIDTLRDLQTGLIAALSSLGVRLVK